MPITLPIKPISSLNTPTGAALAASTGATGSTAPPASGAVIGLGAAIVGTPLSVALFGSSKSTGSENSIPESSSSSSNTASETGGGSPQYVGLEGLPLGTTYTIKGYFHLTAGNHKWGQVFLDGKKFNVNAYNLTPLISGPKLVDTSDSNSFSFSVRLYHANGYNHLAGGQLGSHNDEPYVYMHDINITAEEITGEPVELKTKPFEGLVIPPPILETPSDIPATEFPTSPIKEGTPSDVPSDNPDSTSVPSLGPGSSPSSVTDPTSFPTPGSVPGSDLTPSSTPNIVPLDIPSLLDPALTPLIPAIVTAPGLSLPPFPPFSPTSPNTPPTSSSTTSTSTTPKPCNPAGGCGSKMENTINANNQQINNNNQQLNNITNQMQALDLSLLQVINTKLGDQISNGGIGGTFNRLYDQLKVDRYLNIIATITTLHNAVMLSRDLGETLSNTVDTVASAAGFQFQDAEGNQVGFSGVISGTVLNWAINIFGEEDVRTALIAWKKANRMYQAGANIIDNIREITETARVISELTVERVSIIGNALRESSAVLQDSYDQFEEEFNGVSKFSKAFDNFENGVTSVSEQLESIEMIANDIITIQDSLQEISSLKQDFVDSQQNLQNTAKNEYADIQSSSEVGSVTINNYSFAKDED